MSVRFPTVRRALPVAVLAATALLVGCSAEPVATPAPVASPSASPTASAQPLGECARPNLTTVTSGVLTVATDTTPEPPYFVGEDDDPVEPDSGLGFESALTYAIAAGLGFRSTEVEWVSVPFGADGLPTETGFDFAVNQVPITRQSAKVVDFSVPYLTVTADNGDEAALPGGTGADHESASQDLGLVFAKGNPLVTCVNEVLAELDGSGELEALAGEWLSPA